jgi:hypothetical protein
VPTCLAWFVSALPAGDAKTGQLPRIASHAARNHNPDSRAAVRRYGPSTAVLIKSILLSLDRCTGLLLPSLNVYAHHEEPQAER